MMKESVIKASAKIGKNILLLGGAGSGKSVLAEKLGMEISKGGKSVAIFRRHSEDREVPLNLTLIDSIEPLTKGGFDCVIVDDLDSTYTEALNRALRRGQVQVVATVHSHRGPNLNVRDRLERMKIDPNILDNFHTVSDVEWRQAT